MGERNQVKGKLDGGRRLCKGQCRDVSVVEFDDEDDVPRFSVITDSDNSPGIHSIFLRTTLCLCV